MNIRQSRKVKVVCYDPAWPTVFNSEAEAVKVALGSLVTEIHHIGSTSIPGAAAKPIIDMMPVVTNIDLVDAANGRLAAVGYSGRGEYGIPGRRFFVKETSGERSHHLHVFQYGNPQIARHLAFRDYMMAHPDELEAYCLLKSTLAKQYPGDIESYIASKDAFIKDIDRKAAGV